MLDTPATPDFQHSQLLKRWLKHVMLPLCLAVVLAFAAFLLVALQQSTTGRWALMGWGLACFLVALLVVMLTSWRIAVQVARPIAELSHAIESLGHGKHVALTLSGQDRSIDRLRHSVNQASMLLNDAHLHMQGALEHATAELEEKNARLEAASQARSRLLAAASHDLRQPLYALTLFSSTLRAGETDPEKITRMMHIEECVASLDQLFSELLDLSRLEAGGMRSEPSDISLDAVFDEVSRNFRIRAESRELRLVVRKTDVWVHADRIMLTRILNNLASNALRYTEHGGVLIGVRYQQNGQIRIDVCDTGCGIAAEHQQRVFEEFYQIKQASTLPGEQRRGLGLGLATVKKLADLCHFQITLNSVPGRGTRVSILLPASQNIAQLPTTSNELPLDISGLRVLAIDDEPSILEGLRILLQEWGCNVRTAHDFTTAIAQLEGWKTPPDLVISDLHLQDDKTGLDVLNSIAQHYGCDPQRPRFARLLVTGETRPERIDAINAQAIATLFKPVTPKQLREAILAAVLATQAAQTASASSN